MKKAFITLAVLCFALNASAQDYANVMELLLQNKRTEARKQFDKQFSKTKNSRIDLILLDAMLKQESGQLDFDESIDASLEPLKDAEFYVSGLANQKFILGDISSEPASDLTYKKTDWLAASPKFNNLPVVLYRKATMERKRYRNDEALALFKKLGTITAWQFCGVFENLNGSGLDVEYEPESKPTSEKPFDANSNGMIGWYTPKTVYDESYHVFINEGQYGAGIIYAQTFVESPERKEYLLSFGANRGIKIFLNDREIYYNHDIQNTNLDAYTIRIPLEKGFNRLLFKMDVRNDQDYFSAQFHAADGSPITLNCSNTVKPYVKSTDAAEPAPEVKCGFEAYFDNLVAQNPNNPLYRFYQFTAYELNKKREEAENALEPLIAKYPNSSLVASFRIRYLAMTEDGANLTEEILKNVEKNDPTYYLIAFNKMQDGEWLRTCPILEIEKYRDQARRENQPFVAQMFDFMIVSRNGDVDGMIQAIEKLVDDCDHNEKIVVLAANVFGKLKNDPGKTVTLLEALYSHYDYYEAGEWLLNYYGEMDRKEDARKIRLGRIERYPSYNTFRTDYAQTLVSENKYEEALALHRENLLNFPYSFQDMEAMAKIYGQMKNTKEAEQYIRKSLVHNSGNGSLRKMLYDITRTPDEIEQIVTPDVYKVIRERRKSSAKTDYGAVILLDEFIVNILPEGGRKSRVTLVYEITGENGIEELKEYNLDSSNTILKSEIVKPDGSLVPAERGNDMLVFPNLKTGDVLHISYESTQNFGGRFYRDFNLSSYFDSAYPSLESSFSLITPAGTQFNTAFVNGSVVPTTRKIGNKTCTVWRRKDIAALPITEPYCPAFADRANTVYAGTIKSWNEIAYWYADLVRKTLRPEKLVTQKFKELFPSGTAGMSQTDIAKTIYSYIGQNITYSSLDFRQSGYVPQKPSRTITTRLGDCKDVSTLFVALAQMAGLQANLVLVATNDNGLNVMPLPANDFNHCIVKVKLDSKDTFLELTDKYLPFRALPRSLYRARALVIPLEKDVAAQPIAIPFDQVVPSIRATDAVVKIGDQSKTFTTTHNVQGAVKSYYNELFAPSTTADVRKVQLEKDYGDKLNKTVTLDASKLVSGDMYSGKSVVESQFTIAEKPQMLGSIRIIDVPFIDQVHARNIVSTETRKYDIAYDRYEDAEHYEGTITLELPEGKKFVEVPENLSLSFGKHRYDLTYELVSPNKLKVTRKADTPWDRITPAQYPDFKKYADQIIEAEDRVVGYK